MSISKRYFLLVLLFVLLSSNACSAVTSSPGSGQTLTTTRGSATVRASPTVPTVVPSTATPTLDELARGIVRNLTLEQKLGQMVIVEFSGASYSPDLQQMIETSQVSGVLIENNNGNVESSTQLTALNATLQAHAHIPLFISTDFEGGYVNELRRITGERPSEAAIGASGSTQYAYNQGLAAAQTLKALGLNVNFMPIVDVLTNANNPGLPQRTFGSDPTLVTNMGRAYLQGLTAGGIIGCLKHFPGLGAASVDPHRVLPNDNRSLAQLASIDLVPYRTLINEGIVPMVMTTHILNPQLDPRLPTSLSPAVVTDLLRNRLHFEGVTISDTLWMGGISNTYPLAQAAVLAVKAGEDLLLGPRELSETRNMLAALKEAVLKGELQESQINAAVERILALKLRYGILSQTRALQLLTTPGDDQAPTAHAPHPQSMAEVDRRRSAWQAVL
ncbi:glycoside hydrolase family 3 protein [Thermogemmatispora carboxidivorans]|uniref:glycoside hydrolase family 3 protein n=1 Tax=Thermogemmatispora carboxidivorans TaxID=1382306 RepID=UPI00069A36DC|nr:glycoside hydrolase family 3 N-terminal domain-containing protein [Thermogemmatispora carboxidivorans]